QQAAQNLRCSRRDRDRLRVQIRLQPIAAVDGAGVAAELGERPLQRHRGFAGALLDLAAEEFLEGGFGRSVGAAVEARQNAQRVGGEDLRLDERLYDLLPQRAQVGAAAASATGAAPVEIRQRERAIVQADLEIKGPERAALVSERRTDQ